MTILDDCGTRDGRNDIVGRWERPLPLSNSFFETLRTSATLVECSSRQPLSPTVNGEETIYLPTRGTLVVDGGREEERPGVLGLLYEGDIFTSSSMPPFENTALSTSNTAVVLRMPRRRLVEIEKKNPEIADWAAKVVAHIQARLRFHIACLSSQTSETRVLSLLTEFAYRLGEMTGNQTTFEVPLSRTAMASYLALNADTLSRIMSKLRSNGLISTSGRNWLKVHDLPRLLSLNPFAETITALHKAPGSPA